MKDSFWYGANGAQGCKGSYRSGYESYGPSFGTGDVIGCGIVNRSCFFTKNGEFLGVAFKDVPTGLHPTVGINAGNIVDGNFGQKAFNYDIERVRQLC